MLCHVCVTRPAYNRRCLAGERRRAAVTRRGGERRSEVESLKRKITAFQRDEEGHWVAELECGHRQHVRHDPPLVSREWVLTPAGRRSRIGAELRCKLCEEGAGSTARVGEG
ncbi:MAG TPA: DUF3565 domain-containing protein [Pyrinomonadaceae bacterium]